jgi:multidrug efflux pump subunit AcrA (membrane-fusion protein)
MSVLASRLDPTPRPGRVREVLAAEGQQVDAGMPLAVVDGQQDAPATGPAPERRG